MKFEFDDRQEEILFKMGSATMFSHHVEFYIQRCYIFFFSHSTELSEENIPNLLEKREKRTLGNLIFELQKAFELEDNFKERLERFVSDRNRFVHGLTVEDKYDLYTDEGMKNLEEFLEHFLREIIYFQEVFIGCNVASAEFMEWADKQKGIEHERDPILDTEYSKRAMEHYFQNFRIKESNQPI